MTIDDLMASLRRSLAEHEQQIASLPRHDVDGHLAACRKFDHELTRHLRTLIQLIGEIEKAREHARTQAEWEAQVKQCSQLRAWLIEALDLFDATWCPEHGHAPKPEQLARGLELRKLAMS